MKNKVKLGQFYTKNSHYIIGNLLNDLEKNKIVVEPFCGEGDLLIFENKYEIYDIEPKIKNCVKRDTLLNPLDFKNKLVITNPPFLAKNKNFDKTIYNLYDVNDLYKAAIKTIIECDGGILILPLNFFSDEDNKIRDLFFNVFEIINLNIFEEVVFSDTTYTICSFSFRRKKINNNTMNIKCCFFPKKEIKFFELKKITGWRVGSDFLELIENTNNIGIKRLRLNQEPNSNLYLRAIDTGTNNGRISLSINKEPFFGKESDRTFATLLMNKKYTEEEEIKICNEFNKLLEINREKYNSLFLTNFRNSTTSYARKRISFDIAYKIISYIIKKENL